MSIYQAINFYYCSGENLVLHPCSGYTSNRQLAKLCPRGRGVFAMFAAVCHVLVLYITNAWGYFNVIRDIETCSSALIRLGSAKIEAGSPNDVLRIQLFLHVTALRLVTIVTKVSDCGASIFFAWIFQGTSFYFMTLLHIFVLSRRISCSRRCSV